MVTNPAFWLLLLVGVPAYWLSPRPMRTWLLAVISVGYVLTISTWGVVALAVLMLCTWSVPAAGGPPARFTLPLRLVLAVLLGYLAWFKYVPELARAIAPESSLVSIAMPLGVSFFTFKLIHVAVEISRGNLRDRSPASFAAYVFLFPIFTAGPIEQYDHFLRNRDERPTADAFVQGLRRIMIGLVKKFIVAEALVFEILMDGWGSGRFLEGLAGLSTPQAWSYLAMVFLYAYFDFAGYSDLAIGASRLFGIRVMENFDNPLVARNLAEFWKRWHMTLAAWTQRYVYMPMLGLTRNPWFGVYATFTVMGLWHAGNVNYLCWGLYHATGVATALAVARARRARGGSLPAIDRIPRWGTALTWVFLVGSSAFACTSGHGGWALVRVLGKMFGVDVSA